MPTKRADRTGGPIDAAEPASTADVVQSPWRNSIASYGALNPRKLKANPANWRTHPQSQRDALNASVDELGWIAPVIVNETTGNLIDGHARVEQAIARGAETIPVAFVRLTVAQEQLALASFDPITALAGTDQRMLDSLLERVGTGSAGLSALLDSLRSSPVIAPETFVDVDENIHTDHTCPKCGYSWS